MPMIISQVQFGRDLHHMATIPFDGTTNQDMVDAFTAWVDNDPEMVGVMVQLDAVVDGKEISTTHIHADTYEYDFESFSDRF